MATKQSARKPLGGSRGASNRVGNYFAAPPAPPVALPAAAAATGAGPAQRPAEVASGAPSQTPNVTPGLDTLSSDAQAPGAGFTQTTPSTPGTLGDFSQAATTGANVLAPAAIGTRDLGLYQTAGMLGTAGKVAGIASDIGAGNYGKAATTAGSFLGGPVGLALGVGRMGYDALKGEGLIGGNVTPGSMASQGLGWANQGLFSEGGVNAQGFQDSGALTSPAYAPSPSMVTDLGTLDTGGGGGGWEAPGLQDSGAITSPVSSPSTSTVTDLGTLDTGGGYGDTGGSDGGGYGGVGGEGTAGSNGPGDGTAADYADGGMIEQPVGLSMSGYADGGEIGSGGPLLAMGFADGGPMGGAPGGMSRPGMGPETSPQMIEMRVNQMARNPQFRQAVLQSVQPLMQSGELTPQEVTTMGQIAMASMQNPKLYPQLRQFVAAQGMSPLPPSYDPMTIIKILSVTRALEQSGGGMAQPGQGQPTPAGQVPPTSQAQMVNPTGGPNGGMLQGPGTGRSDSIGTQNLSTGGPVKVSNGEYVIPEHVVRAKGRDFFDALLRRYSEVPKAEA